MTRALTTYSISRRRLLSTAATGTAGIATAALIGCSSSKAPAKPAAPAGASGPAASNAPSQPKSGGTLKLAIQRDVDTLDPYREGGTANYLPTYLTSSLLIRFEDGKNGTPASGKIIGDAAKSWEQPDPQTIIFKLDPAAKFDNRAPTNGRTITAEDVVQSWKRFAKESIYRTELSNEANKQSPVVSMEAVDASTVRVKLARPDALAIPLIAWDSLLWIQSTEGISGKFDLAKEIHGSGPFILESWKQATGFTFKKNPAWHGGAGMPYVDGINISIIPEQAQTEAQFRAKNIHLGTGSSGAVSLENIPAFAKELKDTKIVTGTVGSGGPYWGLSWLPSQPWKDVRVRRALSMSLDRDTFARVLFDPKKFEDVGVKLNVSWNNPMSAGYGDYWLDPKGKDLGPGAAWLQHNVAEAKKLLDAAGFNAQKPLEFDLIYPGLQYGRDYPTRVETWQSMAAEAGIKLNAQSIDYTEYIPKYFRGRAAFEGKKVKPAAQYPPGSGGVDPLIFFNRHFHSTGPSSTTGNNFPEIDALLDKQRLLTDSAARKEGLKEVQRTLADQVIVIATGPTTEPVQLIWKALRGPGELKAWPGGLGTPTQYYGYWFESQL